jgi:serum/glucocorticoid-regulated kinase 2
MGSDARNLITRLLNREPEGRLGSEGAEEIKKHSFFKTSTSSVFIRIARSYQPSRLQKIARQTDTASIQAHGCTYPRLILNYRLSPLYLQESAVDCSNVDAVFTAEDPVDSVVEGSKISQTVQNQFINFSYTNPNDLGTSPTAVH